jgi:hypothetical protein
MRNSYFPHTLLPIPCNIKNHPLYESTPLQINILGSNPIKIELEREKMEEKRKEV